MTAAPQARSEGEGSGERGILALNGITRRFGSDLVISVLLVGGQFPGENDRLEIWFVDVVEREPDHLHFLIMAGEAFVPASIWDGN